MKYRFSHLFFLLVASLSLEASSTLSLSSDQAEDPASLPYPEYIPLATDEEQPLRPHEKMGSLAQMALAAVGKTGPVLLEEYLPSNVEDQLVRHTQQHERLRNIIVGCIEEIKTKPERQCRAGDWGFAISKPVYRPLELDIQQGILEDWLNLEYTYEDGTTPLLHLIELQIAQFTYEPNLNILYLKKALQTHKVSRLGLVKGLYKVCGIHDDIVSILFPYIQDQLKDELATPQLAELRELYTGLARQERLAGDQKWGRLADLGRRLGFTRGCLNQLIEEVIVQPSEDGVRKVETVYVLTMAGGDVNELVIEGKNGLVKLMEAVCQDDVWPRYGSDLSLIFLLYAYVEKRSIQLSSEDLLRRQHLTKFMPATLLQMVKMAFAWKSSPARMHPLHGFVTAFWDAEEVPTADLELDPHVRRSWQQQRLLEMVDDYCDGYCAESEDLHAIKQLTRELSPAGNYIQWLYDTIQEQELSDREFYGRNVRISTRDYFMRQLLALGAKQASN